MSHRLEVSTPACQVLPRRPLRTCWHLLCCAQIQPCTREMAYWRLHYHLVWATQQRETLITDQRAQLVAQTVYRKARELGVTVHELGGTEDHIHIVASI